MTPFIKEDQDCCEIWIHIASQFSWFSYPNQPGMLSMPHITLEEGRKIFVNFCPSCGKSTRSRNVSAERLELYAQPEK